MDFNKEKQNLTISLKSFIENHSKNTNKMNYSISVNLLFKQLKSVIKCVGSSLSSKLLDHMKKGGDVQHLTPDNVFKK